MAKGKVTKVEVFGEIHWAKVFEENREREGYKGRLKEYDGACTVEMHLDDENVQKLKDAGSAKTFQKKDDNGLTVVKLERKFKNEVFPSFGGAPAVAKADGTPWDTEVDGGIGNGSTGFAFINVYVPDDGYATTRLDGLQVVHHEPFELNGGGPVFADRSEMVDAEKEEAPKPPKKSTKKRPVLDNDELPF